MSKKGDSGPLLCKWTSCALQGVPFDSQDDLAHHVEKTHVTANAGLDLFFCLWEGCKVYNKASYSFGWLQRHVREKHTKERPIKCIMNGCNMSFNTAEALQRHILRHFDRTPSPPMSSKMGSVRGNKSLSAEHHHTTPPSRGFTYSTDEGTSDGRKGAGPQSRSTSHGKVRQRRCSLKVRIPRHSLFLSSSCPYAPIAFNGAHFHTEVLDHKSMSVIRQSSNQLALSDIARHNDTCITVRAQVLGKRKCLRSDEDELLVRWSPRVLPDSWVQVSKYQETQSIPLHQLSNEQLSMLARDCFGHDKLQNRKSKRKP